MTYCPGELAQAEVEGVGYTYGDLLQYSERYNVDALTDGFQRLDGEEIFFSRNPALGF